MKRMRARVMSVDFTLFTVVFLVGHWIRLLGEQDFSIAERAAFVFSRTPSILQGAAVFVAVGFMLGFYSTTRPMLGARRQAELAAVSLFASLLPLVVVVPILSDQRVSRIVILLGLPATYALVLLSHRLLCSTNEMLTPESTS